MSLLYFHRIYCVFLSLSSHHQMHFSSSSLRTQRHRHPKADKRAVVGTQTPQTGYGRSANRAKVGAWSQVSMCESWMHQQRCWNKWKIMPKRFANCLQIEAKPVPKRVNISAVPLVWRARKPLRGSFPPPYPICSPPALGAWPGQVRNLDPLGSKTGTASAWSIHILPRGAMELLG